MNNSAVELGVPVSIAVARFLQEKEFAVATWSGIALESLTENKAYGILRGSAPILEKRFVFFSIRKRRPFIGRLWLEESMSPVFPKGDWVIEVFGTSNADQLGKLAYAIGSRFGVTVVLRLVREAEMTEEFWKDTPAP